MEKVFKIHENGIHMVWKIREDGGVRLLHFSALPFDEKTIKNDYEENGCRLVELEAQAMTDQKNVTEPNIL